MIVTQKIEDVIHALGSPVRVVAIDGATQSGKSTFAVELGKRLGIIVIQMDTFIPEPRKPGEENATYVSRLKYGAIRPLVQNRPLIVEGICIRSVLEQIPLKADRHVYVKAIDEGDFWGDETMCDVNRIREAEEFGFSDDLSRLDTEIRDYHRAYDPVANADVIFERIKTPRK